MPTAEEVRLEQLNARHRAKLAARADGSAPVFETETPVDGTGRTPEAIEARYRAKLARHGKPPAQPEAPAEPKRAPKAAEGPTDGDKGDKGKKPEAPAEPKRGG